MNNVESGLCFEDVAEQDEVVNQQEEKQLRLIE